MKPTKAVATVMLIAAFSALFVGLETLSVGEPGDLFRLKALAKGTPRTLPQLHGAGEWLNSPPLTADELKGKVVLVQFWTYSCVNWFRTLPYVRAWSDKYRPQGLVVIGVHTPEFDFEKDIKNIRRATGSARITYPVAVDSDYAIWRAFANEYWPALYLIDTHGRVRYSHNGEGNYEETERMLRMLLVEAGRSPSNEAPVSVEPSGIEAAADLANLKSPETYLGHARASNFASRGGLVSDSGHLYAAPIRLYRNHWALSGNWTIRSHFALLNSMEGVVTYAFHARDANLVMGTATGKPIRFRVLIDGHEPGRDHGEDTDEQGYGLLTEPRLYQLVRQRKVTGDRHLEIQFLSPGAQAYSFTFG